MLEVQVERGLALALAKTDLAKRSRGAMFGRAHISHHVLLVWRHDAILKEHVEIALETCNSPLPRKLSLTLTFHISICDGFAAPCEGLLHSQSRI